MANSVNAEVVSFNSAFEEALRCLSKFDMSRTFKLEQKKNNFCTDIWKGSTGHVANFLLERSGIIFRSSGVGLQERNFDRETFKCSCGWSASTYCL